MSAPRKEKRGLGTALKTTGSDTLLVLGRNVKRHARQVWTAEGIRLLSAFARTGAIRHLNAAKRHVAAMCAQLEGSRENES
jgi:hypothetical protein